MITVYEPRVLPLFANSPDLSDSPDGDDADLEIGEDPEITPAADEDEDEDDKEIES